MRLCICVLCVDVFVFYAQMCAFHAHMYVSLMRGCMRLLCVDLCASFCVYVRVSYALMYARLSAFMYVCPMRLCTCAFCVSACEVYVSCEEEDTCMLSLVHMNCSA